MASITITLITALLFQQTGAALPSREDCLASYESENIAFTSSLEAFRSANPKQYKGTPEQQICTLYYLWQKEGGGYAEFNEQEGACWNIWGQWAPIRKDTYLQLCTGQRMF